MPIDVYPPAPLLQATVLGLRKRNVKISTPNKSGAKTQLLKICLGDY